MAMSSAKDHDQQRQLATEQTSLLASQGTPTTTPYGDVEENTNGSNDEEPPSAPSGVSMVTIVAVLFIGVFVANAEGSLVLATYGRISTEFNDLENASWLVTSYVLATSASQPIYGKLSDIFGRTNMLLVAYVFFALGCAMCGFGQSLPAVVVGRVVSGIGGAGMVSLVSIMITDLVPLREVGAWRSYIGIIATTGRGLGGPIGGYLADTIGWRWSFLGQCPLTLLAMILTWFLMPDHSVILDDRSTRDKLLRVDFLGAVMLASTILAFLLPLELGGQALPWSHPLIFGLFAIFVALGLMFLYIEAYWAKEPILSIHILKSRNVLVPNIVQFSQMAAQLGMMYTLPIFFQITQNATTTAAGAHLFPAVAGNAIGGLLGGYMTKRTGRYKKLVVFATVCASICYTLLIVRWNSRINIWESLYIIPGGFGNGLITSTAFIALTARVEKDDMAMACSSFYMSQNIGQAIGLATTSAVLQSTLRTGLEKRLRNEPDKAWIIERATSNIDFIAHLNPRVKTIVVDVYLRSLKYAHFDNLAFSLIGFLTSLFIREYKI